MDRGSRFEVFLPRSEATEHSAEAPPPVTATAPLRAPVLIIDDAQALERDGCTVLGARNGREGLRIFAEQREQIDCVLLDLSMPEMDGIQTLQELRRVQVDIPVLLTSGYDSPELETHLESPHTAFLAKPYRLLSLHQSLEALLAGQPQASSCASRS